MMSQKVIIKKKNIFTIGSGFKQYQGGENADTFILTSAVALRVISLAVAKEMIQSLWEKYWEMKLTVLLISAMAIIVR